MPIVGKFARLDIGHKPYDGKTHGISVHEMLQSVSVTDAADGLVGAAAVIGGGQVALFVCPCPLRRQIITRFSFLYPMKFTLCVNL
ncbi:hypothetical protein F9Z35_1388 [Neisseria gonorrhoeae]|nr:hypothetical protein F9Z35_1388 [Neisseria gonorrhoeae]